jgi:hypothetical protein
MMHGQHCKCHIGKHTQVNFSIQSGICAQLPKSAFGAWPTCAMAFQEIVTGLKTARNTLKNHQELGALEAKT